MLLNAQRARLLAGPTVEAPLRDDPADDLPRRLGVLHRLARLHRAAHRADRRHRDDGRLLLLDAAQHLAQLIQTLHVRNVLIVAHQRLSLHRHASVAFWPLTCFCRRYELLLLLLEAHDARRDAAAEAVAGPAERLANVFALCIFFCHFEVVKVFNPIYHIDLLTLILEKNHGI